MTSDTTKERKRKYIPEDDDTLYSVCNNDMIDNVNVLIHHDNDDGDDVVMVGMIFPLILCFLLLFFLSLIRS